MQPYFFPYIGYFQLINAVDTFVIYDDVNFIKGGWINRNNILAQGERKLLTLPLTGASQNKLINEVSLAGQQRKLLETIRHCYSKAPHFPEAFSLLESIFSLQTNDLTEFLEHQLVALADYLGINTQWIRSSNIDKDNTLRGENKIIEICTQLGATHYINMPGGKSLYDADTFSREGIQLSFIDPRPSPYQQFSNKFEPNLSIIDVIMFNSQSQCSELLMEYSLV